MNNAYVCENIDNIKYLYELFYEQFKKINSFYADRSSFIDSVEKDIEDFGIIIFYDAGGGNWYYRNEYNKDKTYNYISIKNLTRKEKLNRILND